ncbi:hypothetical protein Cme02nite_04200 [Catellatospora methionotrophica]|uniref:SWIM-type domain-containing protein n=1 Tax=Catellatospora methionotrophica TaxID=121620 RepID=A0A8J3L5D2_9ACTN|nr:hypothetical protein [Catellatospora methionotrophica]GIG12088.1 hypothetical protein Cme02nite_04200 [Catellatospora methionotrophica]
MRTDLLALTPDALSALTNRGLVKRAAKDLDAAPPTLREDPDGTVRGDFADGPSASLPPTGGLAAGSCDCGATGVCRHLVGLVLACQQHAADSASGPVSGPLPASGAPPAFGAAAGQGGDERGPVKRPATAAVARTLPPATPPVAGQEAWSPGQISDEELTRRIGTRLMNTARRAHRAGYTARVRRATAADAVPQVELPTATVRFLVPGDLGFAHSDAAAGSRDDVLALAVWAFRAADAAHPDAADVRLDVGGQQTGDTGSGLERALALAGTVLREGATELGTGLDATVTDVRRRLDESGLRWPVLAVDGLAEQLTSYRDRSARYRPAELAAQLAELHARHRAVTRPGAVLRSSVLGTAEAAETPLRRARLDSLGCRVHAYGDQRTAEVFLAHADSATVLVLRRTFDTADDGPALARRRVDRSTLGALAGGSLVTESAVRSASRAVRLATSRVAKTTISPSRAAWGELPAALVVRDFAALAAELDALAPRLIRPRVEAELVRVLAVTGVRSIGYAPGDQRIDAEIVDGDGNTAVVSAVHAAAAPGRLDVLAAALAGEHGEVRYVSGTVRRSGGTVLLDPIGLAAGDTVVVPDLAVPQGSAGLALSGGDLADPLAAALTTARDVLAEVPHRGLRHLPPGFAARLATAAQRLGSLGLRRAGDGLTTFGGLLDGDPGEAAEQAWVDAYLRVDLALDMC